MKKLVLIALSLVASAAFAGDEDRNGGGNNTPTPPPTTTSCATCPEINIKAPSVQITSLSHTAVTNKAEDGGYARQNLASNSGNVTITAASMQVVAAEGSFIANMADGAKALATQNLATNLGKVNVNAPQLQVVLARKSFIGNYANANSTAVQNISTNNGCATCN